MKKWKANDLIETSGFVFICLITAPSLWNLFSLKTFFSLETRISDISDSKHTGRNEWIRRSWHWVYLYLSVKLTSSITKFRKYLGNNFGKQNWFPEKVWPILQTDSKIKRSIMEKHYEQYTNICILIEWSGRITTTFT